jgi:uncharacterized protein with NRDE domain
LKNFSKIFQSKGIISFLGALNASLICSLPKKASFMCLITFKWDPESDTPLTLCANRDEFYARPALPAHFWEEAPHVLAGKDVEAGGTWLGISKNGRWAGLTNYRNFREAPLPHALSRGKLVSDFLLGHAAPDQYAQQVSQQGHLYNGFNLLIGNKEAVWYVSNRLEGAQEVPPGLHALSNHLLNSNWPKMERAKQLFETAQGLPEMLNMMQDEWRPADADLPDTGVSLEWERMLSSMFISSEKYGTRCSTAFSFNKQGQAQFIERQQHPSRKDGVLFQFSI